MHNHAADVFIYFAEQFWEAMTKSQLRRTEYANDQIRLNYGLDMLNVRWSGRDYIHDENGSEALGRCYNGLSVTVLPYGVICRYNCSPQHRNGYYIWHRGGDRDMQGKRAGGGGGTHVVPEGGLEEHQRGQQLTGN